MRRAALALLLLGCGTGERSFEAPVVLGGVEVDADTLNRGEIAYMQYCRSCHGATGAGDGRYARSMDPPPANLTTGRYPRTSGEARPTDAQLDRIIREGIDGTGMRPVPMPDRDRRAVVQYLKTLAPVWRE